LTFPLLFSAKQKPHINCKTLHLTSFYTKQFQGTFSLLFLSSFSLIHGQQQITAAPHHFSHQTTTTHHPQTPLSLP